MPAPVSGGWASLPADIVGLVTFWLLAGDGDVVDYIAFRAVCSGWRVPTPTPCDPTLRVLRFRPRGWVALCDGDAEPPDHACRITFFHTRTARCLRVHLPEVRNHRIVGFTDGLAILLHWGTTKIRVLHPFTRVVVNFPPLRPVLSREEVSEIGAYLLDMNAAVCSSASSETSIAVVVWLRSTDEVFSAEADSDWEVHRRLRVWNTLPFQGTLYATRYVSSEIVQVYPPRPEDSRVVANVSLVDAMFVDHSRSDYFLVESGGRMLLVVRHQAADANAVDRLQRTFRLYAVDLNSHHPNLIPVNCLGDRALFLSDYGCLSVSARDLPSVNSNSIYFSLPLSLPARDQPHSVSSSHKAVVMHSLRTGLSEQLALCCQMSCQIHDGINRMRPFTIADHLLTYCHPREWSKGIMFHEYYEAPS